LNNIQVLEKKRKKNLQLIAKKFSLSKLTVSTALVITEGKALLSG
jgi:hypothetical protein